jgi:hypothetical protein
MLQYTNYRTATTYVQEHAKKGWVDVMEHAGFKARLMKAERIKDDGLVHVLPKGEPLPVFPIACLPGAPKDWVRAAGTYVCPVSVNIGLWFDWTENDPLNTAVVPSVKGMNPITGMEMNGLGLESYTNNCPRHNEPFAHGRFCQKCGYEWPAQNYICSAPHWWDGFRNSNDGTVRQFFFSEDEARDIASLVMGREKTVPAFGFAFYKTKIRREMPRVEHIYHTSIIGVNSGSNEYSPYKNYGGYKTYDATWGCGNIKTQSLNSNENIYNDGHHTYCCNDAHSGELSCSISDADLIKSAPSSGILRSTKISRSTKEIRVPETAFEQEVKSVSVGAGAQISQKLEDDVLGVSGWEEKPGGVVRLYFCFEKEFKNIVERGGIKELIAKKEGFLDKLPVG